MTSTYTTTPQSPARTALSALRNEVGKAVVGQDAAVTSLVIALICRGHVPVSYTHLTLPTTPYV